MSRKTKLVVGIIIIFTIICMIVLLNINRNSPQKKVFIQQGEVIQSSQSSNKPMLSDAKK
jgi:hypothetical protein